MHGAVTRQSFPKRDPGTFSGITEREGVVWVGNGWQSVSSVGEGKKVSKSAEKYIIKNPSPPDSRQCMLTRYD